MSGTTLRSDLQTIDIDSLGRALNDPRPTAPGLEYAYWATFSPDGLRIAYLFSRPGKESLGGIGVMRADGTDRRDILISPFLILQHPDWRYAPRP